MGPSMMAPNSAMMVGNSLKSDLIPAIKAGAWAVHVPHDLTWASEHADPPLDHPKFRALSDLGKLPQLLGELAQI